MPSFLSKLFSNGNERELKKIWPVVEEVNDLESALNDSQVQAREMVVEVTLASGKTVRMPGNPMKLSASKEAPYSRPPAVGEHTLDVLEGLLGYSEEAIGQLRQAGTIA